MQMKNRTAFKEWAAIVDVLGRGEQILILRKGGIHEKGKRFDVAHDEFFLFPTFEHQNLKDLKPEGQGLLTKVLSAKPDPETLPVRFYCAVEDSFWVSDPEVLGRLEPFHIWSKECIQARFDWGDTKGLFGIIVRVYSLPETLLLSNLKRYGGCRSWVDLESPLETASLKPVLSDATFEEKKQAILKAVQDTNCHSRASGNLK